MLKRCLKGELATADRLVQTACILPLPDTLDSRRHVRDVVITARREHLPRKGREHEPVVYPADTVRILRDNGRYYLLAIPKKFGKGGLRSTFYGKSLSRGETYLSPNGHT